MHYSYPLLLTLLQCVRHRDSPVMHLCLTSFMQTPPQRAMCPALRVALTKGVLSFQNDAAGGRHAFLVALSRSLI